MQSAASDLKELRLSDTNDSGDAPALTSTLEQLYDALRHNEDADKLRETLRLAAAPFNVNEPLRNGDTLLCLACNKGQLDVVRLLVAEHMADVNLCRSSVNNAASNGGSGGGASSGGATVAPTITISARRQSRLLGGGCGGGSSANSKLSNGGTQQRGDSPLSICIKYGHESIAEYLIDKSADISGGNGGGCGGDAMTTAVVAYADFERSPLQEAIRLNRTRIVEKMLASMFERDDLRTIEWLLAKRYDILRQCLMTESLDTLRVVLPNIIESRRIDGEMLIHILNYLLMKSKIQERKEKVNQILETVMEIGTVDEIGSSTTTTAAASNGSRSAVRSSSSSSSAAVVPFEIYNLDIFVRGFLATLRALFNAVSSDDSRTAILTYRTSLFFFVLKYQKALVSFEQFYADIDTTFDFFYSKMKETGENVLKLVEYFIAFYDTLITMNHLRLTAGNVVGLLRLEHVKKIDILGEFLIQRSLIPLDLRELARLRVKQSMHTFSLYSIAALPLLDQSCKEFLYFA